MPIVRFCARYVYIVLYELKINKLVNLYYVQVSTDYDFTVFRINVLEHFEGAEGSFAQISLKCINWKERKETLGLQ